MAVGDDLKEGFMSLDSVGGKEGGGDVLSVEDLAWADSCLIKEPEISESNWETLKDALLDIVSHQPNSVGSLVAGRNDTGRESETEMITSVEGTKARQNLKRAVDGDVQINEAAEENSNEYLTGETDVSSWSASKLQNAFLPTYRGEMLGIENSDSEGDLDLPSFVTVEPSDKDIFKIWDLDIAAEEEGELIKQLDKALSEVSLQPTPSTLDDSGSWKGLKEETLDNLVAGIENLSL